MGTFRTIRRRSFYAAAAVSTLFLLATLIVWPVSHYRFVVAAYADAARNECELCASGGRVFAHYQVKAFPMGFRFEASPYAPDNPSLWSYMTWNSGVEDSGAVYARGLGATWYRLPRIVVFLGIPFSYLAVLFSILPLLAFRAIRRRRRAGRVGLCPKCGYDLRAQHAGAGGGVCPECGIAVARK